MEGILNMKAQQAQICYEDLLEKTGLHPKSTVVFRVDEGEQALMERACHERNPFPGVVKLVLLSMRKKAVKRLFEYEKVLQTGPAAAALALNAALSKEIGQLRGVAPENGEVVCDVGFAGLQVIRLFMMAYEGSEEFVRSRYQSAIRVYNALNGSSYKYRTKNGRFFSTHVYYESQKRKAMSTLGIQKDPDKFQFGTLPFDKRTVSKAIAQWDAQELEEAIFEDGACGCMLRSRSEWEAMPVGKAVCEMPVYRLAKEQDTPAKAFGPIDKKRGPLSGVKVLDLTHIIAGPVCTRLLAEQGADVLMIRRGDYLHQEQAMLELDGWAGKNSIQLDFNIPEQLARAKELVKEADVVVCSYQNGALDRFGLSCEDIHALNPNVIYASLMCFSDTVWKQRPGWAPCAEDITGLSIRNGSPDKPVNLNGVPLDYIPGMILCTGVLQALEKQLTEGGSYTVTGSLTRGGYWLHECTDRWEAAKGINAPHSRVNAALSVPLWDQVLHTVPGTAVGAVGFPTPATWFEGQGDVFENMRFQDGQTAFQGGK